jgi:Spy/CpxP family protein refolding chaperone
MVVDMKIHPSWWVEGEKTMKTPMIFLTILTAGALAAQTTAPPAAQPAPNAGHPQTQVRRHSRMARLVAGLNLTADQQKQTRQIFGESRTEMKALAPKFRADRAAMAGAVKSGSEQQIDQVAQQDAQLRAQAEAIHAKTLAKFYSILNPDQKAKVDQRMNRMLGVSPRHQGRRSTVHA